MKKSKRLLSLFLVLVLVAALMPVLVVGALADGTVIDGETVYGSETRGEKILQFDKTRNGHSIASGYTVDVSFNRYAVKYGSALDYLDWGYRDETYWLIPQGNGVVDFTIERTQAPHAGSTDINRWWRWTSWVNDAEWRDDGLNGMYAHIDGTKNDDHLPIVKSNTTKNCIIDFNRGDYYTWTGGGVNRANYAVVKVDSDNLAVGTTGVLRSANGTKYLSEVAQSWVSNGWIRAGDPGIHNIIICEEKDVVYDLNGGDVNGDTNDQRYVCWTTGNKNTSQLHDIAAEPVKEGYVFIGWKCVENDGASDPKVGTVYQTTVKDGFAVVSNVRFEAQWVKDTFKVAHVHADGSVTYTTHRVSEFGSYQTAAKDQPKQFVGTGTLDLTKEVSDGYLYGGTFAEEACMNVADFNGGTADSFVPVSTEEGTVYYVWEVSDKHLQPSILCTHSKNAKIYKVEETFLICAVDRNMYQEAGFVVNGTEIKSMDLEKVNSAIYEKIAVKAIKTGATTERTYFELNDCPDTKTAKIACVQIAVPEVGRSVSVVPYWVTLDGQTVYGVLQAALSNVGEGPTASINGRLAVNYSVYPTVLNLAAPVRSFAAPMMLMSTYTMGQDTSPAEIPDEPDEPDVPDVPDTPDEPEVKAVLNVVDGSESYTVVLGGEIALTPVGQSGKLFAGWFADEAFSIPADLSAVSDGDTVYAKYVSDKYLQVKYSFALLTKTLSVTSAVDSKSYTETGYIVSTKKGDQTVVVSKYASTFALQNANQLFGANKKAPLMNIDYKLSGLSKNDKVTVTPYLVTADGTTVYGTARTLTFNGLTMKG